MPFSSCSGYRAGIACQWPFPAPDARTKAACIAATQGIRQASGRFRLTDARVRKALRLLPLPLCIAMSLTAQAAEDRPEDWRLCPIQDAVPAFADAQQPVGTAETRTEQPTDIEGDQLAGTEARPEFEGNVALRRGDQFLGTNKLTFDSDSGHYVADCGHSAVRWAKAPAPTR